MTSSDFSSQEPVSTFGQKGTRLIISILIEIPVGMIIALLFGMLLWLSRLFDLPYLGPMQINPVTALPMLVGLAFGPVSGFLTGFLGNMFSDFLAGWGFFWYWDFGFGLMGLLPGLMPYRIRIPMRILFAETFVAAGVFVGTLFSCLLEMVVVGVDMSTIVSSYFIPQFTTYVFFAMIFVPLVALLPKRIPGLIIDLFQQMPKDSQSQQ